MTGNHGMLLFMVYIMLILHESAKLCALHTFAPTSLTHHLYAPYAPARLTHH